MTPLARAYGWIASRAHSENDLRRKLLRYTHESEAEEIIVRLKKLHLLDDLDFSRKIADYRLKEKHQGPRRIAQELRTHGVEEPVVRQAVQAATQETPERESAEKAVADYLRRRAKPQNAQEAQRLIRRLYAAGFSGESIRVALNKLVFNVDFDYEIPEIH